MAAATAAIAKMAAATTTQEQQEHQQQKILRLLLFSLHTQTAANSSVSMYICVNLFFFLARIFDSFIIP
jgi:hypothetical protein